MSRYRGDSYSIITLESLLKIKDKNEFIAQAKKLAKFAMANHHLYLVYRIARELDNLGASTIRLENFIVNSGVAYFILKFAKDIKKINIKKLQTAIILTEDMVNIARFACFIRGSDKKLIEKIISKSTNAKAAYLYLQFIKGCNVHKLKHIILKSKRPRYLFTLATMIKSKKELDVIQDLIIESNSNTYMRMFGKYIKTADIKKLENKVIQSGNVDDMKKFAKAIKSPRLNKLSLLF